METDYHIVYCTCPDDRVATELARLLVEKKLAACVNLIPHLKSIYQWKGEVTEGTEVLLMIKTTSKSLKVLEAAIVEHHPYEFPEYIASPITYGNANYLAWVDDVVEAP